MKDFFEYVWTTKNNEFIVVDRKKALISSESKQKKAKYTLLALFIIGVICLCVFVYFSSQSSFKEAFFNYWYLFTFGIILSFASYAPYVKLKNLPQPEEKNDIIKGNVYEAKEFVDVLVYTSGKNNNLVPFTIKVCSNENYVFINDFISIYQIEKKKMRSQKEEKVFLVDDKKIENLYMIIINSIDGDLNFFLDQDHVYNIIKN